MSPSTGPTKPKVKWEVELQDYDSSTPLVGTDGTVYVFGGRALGLGKHRLVVHALTPRGEVKWRLSLDDSRTTRYSRALHPCLGPNGAIYAQTGEFLFAISPQGSLAWEIKVGRAPRGMSWGADWPDGGPITGPDGTIYVATREDRVGTREGRLSAITPSGEVKWSVELEGSPSCTPAFGPDGTIYVAAFAKDLYLLYAIWPTGKVKWTCREARAVPRSIAVGLDGTVYLQDVFPRGLRGVCDLFAVRSDGSLGWKRALGGLSSNAKPWSVGPDGSVRALEASAPIFHILSPGGDYTRMDLPVTGSASSLSSWATIDAGGTMYMTAIVHHPSSNLRSGWLGAFGADGARKWLVPNIITSSLTGASPPAMGADGTLYVGSHGRLYAIGEDK